MNFTREFLMLNKSMIVATLCNKNITKLQWDSNVSEQLWNIISARDNLKTLKQMIMSCHPTNKFHLWDFHKYCSIYQKYWMISNLLLPTNDGTTIRIQRNYVASLIWSIFQLLLFVFDFYCMLVHFLCLIWCYINSIA